MPTGFPETRPLVFILMGARRERERGLVSLSLLPSGINGVPISPVLFLERIHVFIFFASWFYYYAQNVITRN